MASSKENTEPIDIKQENDEMLQFMIQMMQKGLKMSDKDKAYLREGERMAKALAAYFSRQMEAQQAELAAVNKEKLELYEDHWAAHREFESLERSSLHEIRRLHAELEAAKDTLKRFKQFVKKEVVYEPCYCHTIIAGLEKKLAEAQGQTNSVEDKETQYEDVVDDAGPMLLSEVFQGAAERRIEAEMVPRSSVESMAPALEDGCELMEIPEEEAGIDVPITDSESTAASMQKKEKEKEKAPEPEMEIVEDSAVTIGALEPTPSGVPKKKKKKANLKAPEPFVLPEPTLKTYTKRIIGGPRHSQIETYTIKTRGEVEVDPFVVKEAGKPTKRRKTSRFMVKNYIKSQGIYSDVKNLEKSLFKFD